jgi:hypothetical protein
MRIWRVAMTRVRTERASEWDSSLIDVLLRAERLYHEGKLELQTHSERQALLRRTIERGKEFEKSLKKELAVKTQKALSL